MANIPPTLTGLTSSRTVAENDSNATPQLIDSDVVFDDLEENLDGGTLTVTGLLAEDRIAVRDVGLGPGEIGVSGSDITYGGTVIGSFTGGIGGTFTVTFNAAATAAAVDALVENLTYANVEDVPTESRTLRLEIADGDGADIGAMPGMPTYTVLTGAANPLSSISVGAESMPNAVDLDGDGDLGIVLGAQNGLVRSFRNEDGTFIELTGTDNPFDGVTVTSRSAPAVVDLEVDGDMDVVLGSLAGTLRTFRNQGGVFTELTGTANPFNGFDVGAESTPSFGDLDGDGDADLLVGSTTGVLFAFRNDGGTYVALTGTANPFNGLDVGNYSAPRITDLDGDGDADVMVGTGAGTIRTFRKDAGTFTELTGTANPFNGVDVGSEAYPGFIDLDGDGDRDVMVGTTAGPLAALENTLPHYREIVLHVTAENDAPTIVNLDGDMATFTEDQSAAFTLLDVGLEVEVTDPDSENFAEGSLTVSIVGGGVAGEDVLTLDPSQATIAAGMVSVGGTEIGEITGDGLGGNDLVIILNRDATPALTQLLIRALAYDNSNSTDPDTTQRSLEVVLVGSSGGTDSVTVTVDVVAVNDAPSGADASDTLLEDQTYVFSDAPFQAGYSDPDGNALGGIVIVSLATAGTLLFDGDGPGGTAPAAVTAGQAISLAELQAGALSFVPGADANGAGYASFTFQVRDDGGTAGAGVDLDPTVRTFTFDVTAVNDEPTLTGSPLDPTFMEGDPASDLFGSISASTVEAGQTFTSMTLTVAGVVDGADEILVFDGSDVALTDGNSVVTATNGLTVNVALSSGTATLSFTGATLGAAALQTLIDGLAYRNDSEDPTAGDRIVTVTQLVDSGSNTAPDDNVAAFALASAVDMVAVNDAPSGADASDTGLEDQTYVFSDAPFQVGYSDPEGHALGGIVVVSLATAGTLLFDGDGPGGTAPTAVTAGQEISLAELQAGALSFVPVADANGADYASFTFQVRDDGGTAESGIDLDPTVRTFTFDVTAVNDEPTLTGSPLDPTFTEGDPARDLFGTIAASTVEAGQTFTSMTLTVAGVLDGAEEVLVFDGSDVALTDANSVVTATNGLTVNVALSSGTATLSFTGAALDAAALQALIDGLAYRNDSEDPTAGNRVVTVTQLVDSGSNTAPDDNVAAFALASSVEMVAVNDPPSGADASDILLEDQTYVFSDAPFQVGYSDPDGNALGGIVIVSLATAGTLWLDGDGPGGTAPAAVTAGQAIALAELQAGALSFVPGADANGADYASFTFQVRDDGGTAGAGIDLDPTVRTFTFDVTAVNDEPTLTGSPLDPTFMENDPASDLFGSITASTVDAGQTFSSMTLTVAGVVDGADEILVFDGSDVALTHGNSVVTATNGLTVNVALSSGTATLSLTGATLGAAALQTLIDGLAYRNDSEDPTAGDRIVTVTQLVDSGSNTAPDDNVAAFALASTVDLFIAEANDDLNNVFENGVITNASVAGNDTDPDVVVVAVNGVGANVGTEILLGSGARLTMGSDGIYQYNPDGRYGWLISAAKAAQTGAVNSTFVDAFTYTIDNGDSATVAITIDGMDSADDQLHGDASNNVITGTAGADLFVVSQGGNDVVSGGGGNGIDRFYFGAAFDGLDSVDGGGGEDSLILAGDYAVTFTAQSLVGIERLRLLHDAVGSDFDYSLTTIDANVAAGATLRVDGADLAAGEDLVFLGHAETNGRFLIFGGSGNDVLAGGAKNDEMTGGAGNDALWGMPGNDLLDGGPGADTLTGGTGSDRFLYAQAADSTGTGYDRLNFFEPRIDRIDLPGAWNGWAPRVTMGTLNEGASFNADLAAAVDANLEPGQSVLFTPSAGTLAGTTFIVADGNADGNYTAGADYVFQFTNAVEPPANFSIFI